MLTQILVRMTIKYGSAVILLTDLHSNIENESGAL
jgi:hypothetical protein